MRKCKATSLNAVNCPVCDKTLSRRADLARHMKLHDPDKEKLMIVCTWEGCKFKTLQRSNFNTHWNMHTKNYCYECEDCNFTSTDPSSLSKHRKRSHAPGANSGRQSTKRNEGCQKRRAAPYPSPSPASIDGLGSLSPADPSLEIPRTPVSELSYILHQATPVYPESIVDGRDVKNTIAAYSTQLIGKYPQDNASGHAWAQNVHPGSADMVETPYPHLPAPEQGNSIHVPAQALPDIMIDGVTNALSNDFLFQQATTTPYNPPLSLPPFEFPSTINIIDGYDPLPEGFSMCDDVLTYTNAPYDPSTDAALFDAEFSRYMSAPVLPQPVDATYFPTYSPPMGHHTEESYIF